VIVVLSVPSAQTTVHIYEQVSERFFWVIVVSEGVFLEIWIKPELLKERLELFTSNFILRLSLASYKHIGLWFSVRELPNLNVVWLLVF